MVSKRVASVRVPPRALQPRRRHFTSAILYGIKPMQRTRPAPPGIMQMDEAVNQAPGAMARHEQPLTRSPAAGSALRIAAALLSAAALVLGSFVWQGRYGFNIADEGFFWYGVQRVQAGEAPLVDFMSYDPGRYYWSAALMGLLRQDGLVALRAATAAFQWLGLFVGLALLLRGRSKRDLALFTLAAVTLLVWMYPWFKIFDTSASLLLIGGLTLLVQRPSPRRFFLAGVTIGLAAVFGRNHGIYGLTGLLGVTIYLACLQREARTIIIGLGCCGCGVVVGYLPVLIMLVVVPGFPTALWESIRVIFIRGATNLPLPVPWPWLVAVADLPPAKAVADVLTGIFFVALLAFGVSSLAWIIHRALQRRAVAPEFVASSALVLPYAHYAFSRADVTHLALGIFPLLIGVFALLRDGKGWGRWLGALAITGASLLIALPLHPGWNCRMTEPCVAAEVGGDALTIEPAIAMMLTMLKDTSERYAPGERSFLVTPLWPGAYPAFKRKSPMWEIYALFPQSAEFERREIERIKRANPGFVLVLDLPLDGQDALRFRATHPLIEGFIRDNFDPVAVENWPSTTFQFYKSR
jgi:hypothetical protein